jgi:hypothetical protein
MNDLYTKWPVYLILESISVCRFHLYQENSEFVSAKGPFFDLTISMQKNFEVNQPTRTTEIRKLL